MINKEIAVLEAIRTQMEGIKGHLGFYYKNLATGYEYGVGEDEEYLAASVIKLPLYMHILNKQAAGELTMDDSVVTLQSDKVPGCGALSMFTEEVQTDIRTLCRLMICISDNTATNRLIRLCGLEDVECGFVKMGLEKTKIRRFLFDSVSSAKGIQNTVCPKELGMLLEKLYRGEFINADVSREVTDTLLAQQINHKLGGKICDAVAIAHKTGEDDDLSNDVGIVYAKTPFIACFAGHDTDVYLWEDLIRRAAYDLYKVNS